MDQKLDTLLKCPVCDETLENPMFLYPCGHVYCSLCVGKGKKESRTELVPTTLNGEDLLFYLAGKSQRVVELFRMMDTDRSGRISRSEFGDGLKRIDVHFSSEQIEALLNFIDEDGNENIEYSELRTTFEAAIRKRREAMSMKRRETRKMRNVRRTLKKNLRESIRQSARSAYLADSGYASLPSQTVSAAAPSGSSSRRETRTSRGSLGESSSDFALCFALS